MASPDRLLQAIIKSDPDVGVFLMRDIAMSYGADCASEYKEEVVKTLPSFYANASQVLTKRLGRNYIERVSKGLSPEFDSVLKEACDRVNLAYELVTKASQDTFIGVHGNEVTVYRDESTGRFTKKGQKPDTSTPESFDNLAQQFYQPRPGDGGKTKENSQEKRWRIPSEWAPAFQPSQPERRERASHQQEMATWREGYKEAQRSKQTDALANYLRDNPKPAAGEAFADVDVLPTAARSETRSVLQDRVAYGMQSRLILNETTELLEAAFTPPGGKMNRSDFKITADLENAGGVKIPGAPVEWDKNDKAFRLPASHGAGWAITDLHVDPSDTASDDVRNTLKAIAPKNKEAIFQHAWDLSQARAAVTQKPMGTPLNETKVRRSSRGMETAGRALTGLGFTQAGGRMQQSAQLMNEMDQSALRSGLTRAAYRYRGVDAPQIGEDIQQANTADLPVDDGFSRARTEYYGQMYGPRAREMGGDAIEMGQRRDYTSAALANRMQQRQSNAGMGSQLSSSGANYNALAQKIARGIGRGMPSEGVLTDKNGKIVTQSMGIAHDNFLPFNAEALSKLDGGQYVRTRQLGGMTGEDIRTLLVGNGRAGQVVSNSGVYELEFDPSLRGKQRYNPHTMQMIDTYDRILNQIANAGLHSVPLPPKQQAAAEQRAAQRSGGNPEQYELELKAAQQEQYNMMARVSPEDIDQITNTTGAAAAEEFAQKYGENYMGQRVVPRELQANQQRYIDTAVDGEIKRAQQDKIRALTLNSEGYALALKTLQQFYPYMIRTARFRPWEQFQGEYAAGETAEGRQRVVPMPNIGTQRGGEDRWYTPPGYLRPVRGETKEARELDEMGARLGTPAPIIGENRAYRPMAGMRVIAPKAGQEGAGGGAGGGAAGVAGPGVLAGGSQTLRTGADNLTNSTQQDVTSISDLRLPEEHRIAANETTVADAPDAASQVRMLMQYYGQDPQGASNFLASERGKKAAKALADPATARNIMAGPLRPKANGQELSETDLNNVMQAMTLAVAAREMGKNAQTMSPDMTNVADIPEGDRPVVMDDTGMTPQAVQSRIASNPLMGTANDFFSGVVGTENLSMIHPYEAMDAMSNAVGEYQKAIGGEYGPDTAQTVASAVGDQAKLEALATTGVINNKTRDYIARIIASAGPKNSNGLLGDESARVSENVKRMYRLGHGIQVQQKMAQKATNQTSIEDAAKKFRGPLTAPEERTSKSAGLSDLQRELLWSGVRYLQQHQ